MSSDPLARQTAIVARGRDLARLQRSVRMLVSDLMRGVLDAVTMASPSEIGELIRANAQRSRAAPRQSEGTASLTGRTRGRRNVGLREPVVGVERDPPPFSSAQDPFAITSPSELLASELKDKPNEPQQTSPDAMESVARLAATPGAREKPELPAILQSPASLSTSDKEAESERRPRIVLREGERLLSATGSGMVIGRERRVSPRQ